MIPLMALLGALVGVLIDRLADTLPRTTHHAPRTTQGSAFRLLPHRPWVLLLLAALYVALTMRLGQTVSLAVATLYVTILALIAIIDLEHRRVLNLIVGPAALLALGVSVGGSLVGGTVWSSELLPVSPLSALAGGAVGFVVFLVIALIYPGGMGMGDVKLAGLIGLMLGLPLTAVALVVGTFAGGVIAAVLMALRLAHRKSYMPYAPALALGSLVALLYGPALIAVYVR